MSLEEVLDILKETEKNFSSLNKKGEAYLLGGNESGKDFFRQGARLLVELPVRLNGLIEKVEPSKKYKLIEFLTYYERKTKKSFRR